MLVKDESYYRQIVTDVLGTIELEFYMDRALALHMSEIYQNVKYCNQLLAKRDSDQEKIEVLYNDYLIHSCYSMVDRVCAAPFDSLEEKLLQCNKTVLAKIFT